MPKDDEHTGCGISPLATGKKDPFYEACRFHDLAYLHNSWHQLHLRRKEVDKYFLNMMLLIADGNPLLIARAHIYYRLARIFGTRFWEGRKL
jgi:hypothetical protein